MNTLEQYFNYVLRKWGTWNLVGLVLIICAVTIFLLVSLPTHQAIIEAQLNSSSIQKDIQKRNDVNIRKTAASLPSVFYEGLPLESLFSSQLELFFDTAYENDIYIESVDYKVEIEPAAKISSYQIILPVNASYTNLRGFTRQLLETIPNAALDNIVLNRRDANETEINAKLQFTLYFKSKVTS